MGVNGFMRRSEWTGASRCRGFAIARLMVTIVIVAIVSTVALPISRDHLDTTHTAQVIADIGAIEIAISRFKAQNHGELPDSLADLRVEQWLDSWGNAYQYRNLEADSRLARGRDDFDSNPLNRDYDLYSMGKDGRSGDSLVSPVARDDVIRGLSGSFYGSVSDYPGASGQQ